MTKSLRFIKYILIALITALAITGVGFIDDKIWSFIIAGIGVLAYAIVGVLYSIKLITTISGGKIAYTLTFLGLLIVGFFLYQGILNFKHWIYSWPLWLKIFLTSFLIILTGILVYLYIKAKLRQKKTTEAAIINS